MARKTGFDVDADGQIDRSDLEEPLDRGGHDIPRIEALIPRLIEVRDLEVIELSEPLRDAILEVRRITKKSARLRVARALQVSEGVHLVRLVDRETGRAEASRQFVYEGGLTRVLRYRGILESHETGIQQALNRR